MVLHMWHRWEVSEEFRGKQDQSGLGQQGNQVTLLKPSNNLHWMKGSVESEANSIQKETVVGTNSVSAGISWGAHG